MTDTSQSAVEDPALASKTVEGRSLKAIAVKPDSIQLLMLHYRIPVLAREIPAALCWSPGLATDWPHFVTVEGAGGGQGAFETEPLYYIKFH